MQRLIFMLISGLLLHAMVLSQGVSVSADNALPDASAILDISSKTQGVLFPRMSESDRIAVANPAEGLWSGIPRTTAFGVSMGYSGARCPRNGSGT